MVSILPVSGNHSNWISTDGRSLRVRPATWILFADCSWGELNMGKDAFGITSADGPSRLFGDALHVAQRC